MAVLLHTGISVCCVIVDMGTVFEGSDMAVNYLT
jgi:uncharacterized protein YfcZ (UPF0381/DUF406 family)